MTSSGDDLDWLLADSPDEEDHAAAIPVTVVTGFLGAGKTTLVNRALSGEHGLRLAVLVNDFGAIGIDSELIVGVEGGTISLANGCVCCEIRDDLMQAVRSVFRQDADLDGIVLEASGVAEPSGIARTFASPDVRHLVRLDGIIAVVDAEQLPRQVDDPATSDLVHAQIGYSDLVILNKIDLADRARVDRIRSFVHERLPGVRIIEAEFADVPFDVLVGTASGRVIDRRDTWADAAHEHRFASWVYRRSDPVDLDALRREIASMPRSVFRVKGFVHAAGDPDRRYVLQAVGMRSDVSAHDEWSTAEPATTLVVIADSEHVDRGDIERRLDAALSP